MDNNMQLERMYYTMVQIRMQRSKIPVRATMQTMLCKQLHDVSAIEQM